MKKEVDYSWKYNRERWAIIENASGRLETVPESQLTELNNVKTIYKLEDNGK